VEGILEDGDEDGALVEGLFDDGEAEVGLVVEGLVVVGFKLGLIVEGGVVGHTQGALVDVGLCVEGDADGVMVVG
jgi:hypothetical protein